MEITCRCGVQRRLKLVRPATKQCDICHRLGPALGIKLGRGDGPKRHVASDDRKKKAMP